jgi:hypothetical protein
MAGFGRCGLNTRWNATWVLAVACLAGCTSGGPVPTTSPSTPGQTTETTEPPVTPSITRNVPAPRRQSLAVIPTNQFCGLVSADDLGKLAFPVLSGVVQQVGGQPPVRGCRYESQNGTGSVLIGEQPPGYDRLGDDQVNLGSELGTETQHADDCTVFAAVSGATLQVVVTGADTTTNQCDEAQAVAQYAIAGLRR